MCSEDIPRGLVALPEASRRRFLGLSGAVGGAVTAAALTGCTEDVDQPARGRLSPDEAIIEHTYTGLSTRSEGMTLRQLVESSDAAAPDNQLRGVHRMLWDVGTQKPYVALSFDDGPDPRWTPRVLDALRDAGAKATFFLMGYNVDHHRELAHRVLDEGHDIGNHTWSHSDLARLSRSRQIAEINDAGAAIEQASGQRLSLVRPPYGSFSATTKSLGVPLALWNVDTLDWRHRSAVKTVAAVKAGARPGAVVLLHDIHASTADAVPEIVKMLSSEGYTMVTMSELLASCGGAPAGQTVSGC